MHPKYFGECYDNAKREIMRLLAPRESWAVHPMYFVKDRTEEDCGFIGSYQRYLNAAVVDGDIWRRSEFLGITSVCRQHLLLDPDTGLGWDRDRKHVSVDEFAEIVTAKCRRNKLTMIYPESTEAMYAGVDTRVDGQGRANRPGQVPIDGDEGGVK